LIFEEGLLSLDNFVDLKQPEMIVEENEEGVLRLGGLFDKEQSLNILQFVYVLFIFDQQLEDQLFGLLTTLVLFYPPIVLYNLADK
jgi:hypothetical protein